MMSRKQLEEIATAVEGIAVWGCLPGSASAQAGVVYGDIVISVNGKRTQTIDDYLEARTLRADAMEVRLFRAGKEFTLLVELRPPAERFDELEAPSAEENVSASTANSPPKGLSN
jgi:S1-C subfamily serine protease